MCDAVVFRHRREQAQLALLLLAHRRLWQRMNRYRRVEVDPQRTLAACRRAIAREEATGRRGAVFHGNVTEFAFADAGRRRVANGRAEERGREALQLAFGIEDQDLRGVLVDDREGKAAIVARSDHPTGNIDNRVRHLLLGVHLIERLRPGGRHNGKAKPDGEDCSAERGCQLGTNGRLHGETGQPREAELTRSTISSGDPETEGQPPRISRAACGPALFPAYRRGR